MTYDNDSSWIDLEEVERRRGHMPKGGPVIRTAEELRRMVFPPVSYVVPGFIAEGCTVLAGAPKLGKSWFVLDVGLAVARGGFCLGETKCPQGDVLYLALEDNERRLQRRITKVLGVTFDEWPEGFTYATEWPRSNEGGVARIREWIATAKNPRLVIVDVLAMFRAPRNDKQSVYEGDYLAIKELQKIASDTGCAIVIVHHVKKGGSDLDPFEEVSGTFGIMGAADAGLILRRTSNGVTLYARGRDIEEAETAVTFDRDNCRWRALGDAGDVHKSDERGRILAELKDATEPMGAREIAFAVETTRNAVDILLYRMVRAGEVLKVGRGLYIHPDRTDLSADDAGERKNGKKERSEATDFYAEDEAQENERFSEGDKKPESQKAPESFFLSDLSEVAEPADRKKELTIEEAVEKGRMVRAAERREPGIVARLLEERLAAGEEPTREKLDAQLAAAIQSAPAIQPVAAATDWEARAASITCAKGEGKGRSLTSAGEALFAEMLAAGVNSCRAGRIVGISKQSAHTRAQKLKGAPLP
ncbi:hypothetical protein GCM10008171_19680 [Methylopila jiangsuensis]|uniref:AAA family ATPase n=1 Tax=Methylopila jiangsuensis TaxID=586230 RepID=A0A9W6JJ72_9HYPH|nr:AAA family ATPase [Methylopila jiangsuensis]MDR6286936.1 hypothetical protein [Methylopila jiangsuensis]GLK76714.1 hypothetical protein GCM10008171_19680 [Methylopila jiangsuensis]